MLKSEQGQTIKLWFSFSSWHMNRLLDLTTTIFLTDQANNVTILDKRPHLRAGEKQRFVCVATGSRPEAIISWWVDGEAVRAEGGRVTSAASGERTTSSLYFVPRPQDSGKTLHCRASTPQIHRGVIQDSWKLDIQCELFQTITVFLGNKDHLTLCFR